MIPHVANKKQGQQLWLESEKGMADMVAEKVKIPEIEQHMVKFKGRKPIEKQGSHFLNRKPKVEIIKKDSKTDDV